MALNSKTLYSMHGKEERNSQREKKIIVEKSQYLYYYVILKCIFQSIV